MQKLSYNAVAMKIKNMTFSRIAAALLVLTLGSQITACELTKSKRLEKQARLDAELKEKLDAEKAAQVMTILDQEKRIFSGIEGTYTGDYISPMGGKGTLAISLVQKTSTQLNDKTQKTEAGVLAVIQGMSFDVQISHSVLPDFIQINKCSSNGVPLIKELRGKESAVLTISCTSNSEKGYNLIYKIFLDNIDNGQEPYASEGARSSKEIASESQSILKVRSQSEIDKLKSGQVTRITRIGVSMQRDPEVPQIVSLRRADY